MSAAGPGDRRPLQEPLQPRERRWQVLPPEPDPDVVAVVADDAARQEQDALVFDKARPRTTRPSSSSRSRAKPIEPPRGRTHDQRPAWAAKKRSRMGEVAGDDPARPGEDGVAGPQPDQREDLGRGRRADRRVVLERGAAGEQPAVARREPADPQPGQREGLRHHAERDAVLERVRAGGQPIALVELEEAVDLVGEEVDPALGELGGQRASTPRADGSIPVGLCGALTTTRRVSGRSCGDQPVGSSAQPSASCRTWSVTSAPAARADLVQALVAGPRDDGMVARAEQDVREAEDRLLCAGEDEDVVRRERVVERGDLGPEERMSGRLRVAEPQVVPERGAPRRRRGRGGRPSASPRRPTRTGDAGRRTPSGRR